VPAHPDHRREHGNDEQDAYPCSLRKLGDQYHERRDARRDGPEAIDEHVVGGAVPSHASPVRHHPRLRQRECEEGPYRVERDQSVRHAAKQPEEYGREGGEHKDALGVHQAATTKAKCVRQITVLGHRATQAREISKGRVGGEREDEEDGADGHVVEPSPASDGRDQHREDALIAWLPGISSGDTVGADEIGDAGEEEDQQSNDNRQCALGCFNRRFPKGSHAIADGFDPRHRRAAVREHLQQ